MDDAELRRAVADPIARTVALLRSSNVHDEALAVHKQPKGLLAFATTASMKPVGRAWRLGVLLLDSSAVGVGVGAAANSTTAAYRVGEITRAIEPGRAAVNRTALGEKRRADRLTASRGPFAKGDVVNFDYTPIDLSVAALRAGSGAIFLAGETVMFRWGGADLSGDTDGVSPLEAYLADRLAVVLETP